MFLLRLSIFKFTIYLLVILLQVVASVQEAMASHHPLLLHQTLEPVTAAVVRVQHELHQRGHHTIQVSVFFLCARATRVSVYTSCNTNINSTVHVCYRSAGKSKRSKRDIII